MAAQDRLVGRHLVVIFEPSGGGSYTLSGDQTAFSHDIKLDTVDVSAGSETERSFKDTLSSLDWTLSIFDADQSYLDNIQPRAYGKLIVRKEGTGTGKDQFSFNTWITGYKEDMPFDGALEIEVSGQRDGAMIDPIGTVQA